MQALMSVAPGGPETLEWQELATPTPKAGEVLIAVHAAGLNFPDTLVIRDLYQFRPQRPFAPGSEVAGTVAAVGAGVTHVTAGQRVIALLMPAGALATHAIAPAAQVVPLPDGVDMATGSALQMTYGTSQYALFDRGHLQPGDCVMILGAAGGVGSAAIELARAAGARVIAAVSSAAKADFCRSLGADHVITYAAAPDRDAQRALTNEAKAAAVALGRPDGVDIVYDAVGGPYTEPALRALGWDGRLLVVGFPAGIPSPPLNLTLLKSIHITGVFWGAAVMRDPAAHQARMAELCAQVAQGVIRPRVTARFPLADAAAGLHLLETRQAIGKVVIDMPA